MARKSAPVTSSPPSSASSLSNAARQRHRHQQDHYSSPNNGKRAHPMGKDGGDGKYGKNRAPFTSALLGIMPAPLPGLRASSSVPPVTSLAASGKGSSATWIRVGCVVVSLLMVAVFLPNLESSVLTQEAPAHSAALQLGSLKRPLDGISNDASTGSSSVAAGGDGDSVESNTDVSMRNSDSEAVQTQDDNNEGASESVETATEEQSEQDADDMEFQKDNEKQEKEESNGVDAASSSAEVQEESEEVALDTSQTEKEDETQQNKDDVADTKGEDADDVKTKDAQEVKTEDADAQNDKKGNEVEQEHQAEDQKSAATPDDAESPEFQCGVYAAPSNIPGAGIGLFAGKDFSAYDPVLPPDLVVPLTDMLYHNCGQRRYDTHEQPFLWSNYVWSWRAVHLASDAIIPVAGVENDWISPGGGAMLNHHFILKNVRETAILIDEEADIDNQSPSSGAFTPYHHRVSAATSDIKAGAELYTSYGSSWFDSRMHATGVVVPQNNDYTFSDHLLKKFERHVLKPTDKAPAPPPSPKKKSSLRGSSRTKKSLLEIPSSTAVARRRLTESSVSTKEASFLLGQNASKALLESSWNVTRYIISLHDAKKHAALPANFDDALRALKIGSKHVANPVVLQTQEWLQENGRCMDSLDVKTSTIPNAGRGVFTKQFVKKGDVIHTAPLIHISNAHSLDTYPIHYNDDNEVWEEGGIPGDIDYPDHCAEAGLRDADDDNDEEKNLHLSGENATTTRKIAPIGQQLLINYAFGHANTTLLLTPYSPTSMFFNHDGDSPNAEIRWPTTPGVLNHDPSYLEKTVEELSYCTSPGLVLEFVATRDIPPNQEVLIHYGEEWQDAWEKHVQQWNDQNKRAPIVTAKSMNENEETNHIIRTQDEQQQQPYPESVFLVCLATVKDPPKATPHGTTPVVQFVERKPKRREPRDMMRPCQIWNRTIVAADKSSGLLEKGQDSNTTAAEQPRYVYTVSLLRSTTHPLKENAPNERITVEGVPRHAIAFRDRVYRARPFHGAGVFRHKMMLPHDLFSQAWADK